MSGATRIQLRRSKGWRKPVGAVVVARPGRWGNPYKVGVHVATAAEAVRLYRILIEGHDLTPLRGHDLACWCPLNQPCHADVLLELANR